MAVMNLNNVLITISGANITLPIVNMHTDGVTVAYSEDRATAGAGTNGSGVTSTTVNTNGEITINLHHGSPEIQEIIRMNNKQSEPGFALTENGFTIKVNDLNRNGIEATLKNGAIKSMPEFEMTDDRSENAYEVVFIGQLVLRPGKNSI